MIKLTDNISFIIPAFNCENTIEESINSILNDNFSKGDEIIIINDASTDGTFDILKKFAAQNEKVKILSHTINKGSAAAARNTGIDGANNELIFCLDADNVLVQSSINKLKTFLVEENCDAVAFGEIHYFTENINNISKKWQLSKEIGFIQNINHPETTPCSSGNYLYTKTSWKKAGRYNESIGGAYDSWAFGVQQLATGSTMKTLGDTFYYHRIGYDSTFIKESAKRNASITILQILLPYLNLIDPGDIKTILLPENIYTWFDNIKSKPLNDNFKNIEKYISLSQPMREKEEPTIKEIFGFLFLKLGRLFKPSLKK